MVLLKHIMMAVHHVVVALRRVMSPSTNDADEPH